MTTPNPEMRRRVAEALVPAGQSYDAEYWSEDWKALVCKIAQLIEALKAEYLQLVADGKMKPGHKSRDWANYLRRFNKALSTGSTNDLEALCYELLEAE